jgi:uncharacterized ParB-like nuclease family protein
MPTEKTAPQTPTLPESDAVQPQDLNPLLDVMSHEFRYAMVPLDAIFVDGEKPDEASVTALANDVLHTGLRHPICIILNDIDGHPAQYKIVTGRTRYAAFLQLGREMIPAQIWTLDPNDQPFQCTSSIRFSWPLFSQ